MVLEDTQWFLRRMVRLTDATTPDVDSDPSGPAEDIADTDCASREIGARSACSHDWSFFPPYTVNRFAAVSNPGVGQKTKGSTKRLRSECLQDASLRWPHLVRTVLQPAGKSLKFQRRSVNVVKMERTLGSLCDAPCEVFGTWEHWAWPEDVTGEASWDPFCSGEMWTQCDAFSCIPVSLTSHIPCPTCVTSFFPSRSSSSLLLLSKYTSCR